MVEMSNRYQSNPPCPRIVHIETVMIVYPLCMYGTIPIAASFVAGGIAEDWLAAFMLASILLNPQLIFYSAAKGMTALIFRVVSCFLMGCRSVASAGVNRSSVSTPLKGRPTTSIPIRTL